MSYTHCASSYSLFFLILVIFVFTALLVLVFLFLLFYALSTIRGLGGGLAPGTTVANFGTDRSETVINPYIESMMRVPMLPN